MKSWYDLALKSATVACVAASLPLAPCFVPFALAETTVQSATPAPVIRRLNQDEYIRSVRNIFGINITVPGRFDPPVREDGLLAIGDGRAAVSSSGFEQYELRARNIAAQVLAEPARATTMPCTPSSAAAFDATCARAVIEKYGRLLYRRPLDNDEASATLTIARDTAAQSHDFYKALEMALTRLLVSPNFIFRIEEFERDPANAGAWRLTDYSLATRLSFTLWDAPPDAGLLDAAAGGNLRTQGGLQAQVNRLVAAPQFADGVRAFFSDMLGFDQFDGLTKDQSVFPAYTSRVAADAKEQILRTVVQLLVAENGDYRDLFTTRNTFMNRSLGGIYNVPVSTASVKGWAPYTFGDNDHRAGILTFAGFLMLDRNHEARTSPTIRGINVREKLLCQRVPPPPGNVDFAIVQDTKDPRFKTARARLTAHRTNPVCAGCHALTDPIGLSLEQYDAVGRYREQENGANIDASGTYTNLAYKDAIGFEQLIRNDTTATNCVVQRTLEYGLARPEANTDRSAVDQLGADFAQQHYSFPALMRQLAMSSAFQSP